jgi:flagellin-like protein
MGPRSRDRAVSPVVGVALMTVIVVLLAAVVGGLALGFDDALVEPQPERSFETTYHASGDGNGGVAYLNVTMRHGEIGDGETVYVVDDDGDRVAWADVWTAGATFATGEYVHIDGQGSDGALDCIREGTTYRVVVSADDTEYVALEHEVTSPPAAGSYAACS